HEVFGQHWMQFPRLGEIVDVSFIWCGIQGQSNALITSLAERQRIGRARAFRSGFHVAIINIANSHRGMRRILGTEKWSGIRSPALNT
ncbi:hypothetical protein, partial [Glutamicibacter sp.]|uniref:hypothetical protein n=1 Tax=Glutamicibacter sp. TaxID=1931995 RepID=UPI002FC6AD27